jgi:ligand-binding sensor domain-containing protein/signal transduction histidine kinase
MMPSTNIYVNRCRRLRAGLHAVIILASLGLATRGFALDPNKSIYQYNCQTWSQQHGLPANGINAITQTDDGYIWLGASGGLIRFDGVNFTLVGMAQNTGLHSTEILSLTPTGVGGGLWFGLKLSGYGQYDGHGNWTFAQESEAGTGWNVPSVMKSKDGRIWITGELASVRSPDGRLQRFSPDDTATLNVISCLEDSRGRIWAGTVRKGLYCLDQGQWVKFLESTFETASIGALAEDKTGGLWVGTDYSLSHYDARGKLILAQFPGCKINALLIDRRGALWVATFGSGLLRYYNGVWSALKKTDGLGDDYVLSLAEDREGNIWIGTRAGLCQLTDVKLPTFGVKEGLNADVALGVSASSRGGLWIGTQSGAAYFNGHAFDRNYATNSDLHTSYVKRVFEARDGDIYTLNGHNVINIYADGKLIASQPTTDMPVALVEDAQGVVVSVGGDLFRVGRDHLTPFPFTNGVKPDLYWVVNLAVDRDGAILVGCANGVCRIKDGVFEQWTKGDGLADTQARWVFEDTEGTIWAGLETGIARIRGPEIRNIRRENGLPDGNIYAIVPDDGGNFWVDSNRGIFCVTRKCLNDVADGKIHSITYVSYNGPGAIKPADKYGQEQSACRTLDGRIWFPGSRGLVMVDPTNLQANMLPPPVRIARARANGQTLGVTNGMIIPPGRGELEFQFSALSYIVPQDIRFRYQLEGYDRQWVEAENRRLAAYNNLKPGRYTFRVTAANADGIWNNTGDSLTFELLPFFYQKAWFYLLCGGLGLAALGGIYAWRVRHLTSRQRALQKARDLLEAEVASRTAELATANTSLQHEEAQLKQRTELLEKEIEERKRMQLEIENVHRELLETSRQAGMSEIASNVLHNVGNVLNSVNVSASIVGDSVKKSKVFSVAKVAALLREHKDDLGTFFTNDPKGRQLPEYLDRLSEHLLADQAADVKELESLRGNIDHIKEIVTMQQSYARVSGVKEIVNICNLVEDSLRMNADSFNRHGLEVIREFEDVPPMNIEKHKILQILVNLLRNAKHACNESGCADKRLTVRVAGGAGRTTISVTDNGVGIMPENLTRIFSHGFTTKKDGHGFGLHSGALAAKEMGGSLTVHSHGPGQGATFALELPCTTNQESHE